VPIFILTKTIKMSDLSIYDLVGKRVQLIEMFEDPFPIEPGTEGTVLNVGADVITVKWDNGRMLGMIWEVDSFEVIG
jgi:hypothetical protein